MSFSIIKKSQLEGAKRIDAEYYKPEYLQKMQILNQVGIQRLGDIAYITDGEHGSPIFDDSSKIRYYSAQHVKDNLIDYKNAKNISKIIDDRNKRSRLQKNDVLLSTVGTIGFAGLISEEMLPANIDRHVARIKVNKNSLDPEFLVVFLNSSFGKFQSIRESTGNVQLNLFIDKIKELKVPKKNNKYITELFKKALRELKKSEELFSQAENLLLEELGLKDFQFEDDLSYIVNFSEVKSVKRIDAEYFLPKYQKLKDKLLQHKGIPLAEFVENVSARFNPLQYLEKTFNYVELANIDDSIGVINGFSEVLGKDAPSRAKRVLSKGDVIVSSIEGSLKKVALVEKEQEGYLASTGFFQFRSKKVQPEYLLVVAKSIVLQMQLQKHTSGTILSAVPQDSLQNIAIPVLSRDIQQKIADLIIQSHESLKKSKELLEQAKREVEKMIENSSREN